jgi:Fic family protein
MTTDRTYLQTHPWINFRPNLINAPYVIWLLLGEVQAKCEYICEAPVDPDIAAYLRHVYLAKGALATTAIEGNSLTEEQVRKLLDKRLDLPPSQEYLGQQIDNVLEAYNLVKQRYVEHEQNPFTVDLLKEYNIILLKNLPLDEDVIPGVIPDRNVTVGRYLGAPREDCEYLLEKLCDWLNSPNQGPNGFSMAMEILRAIIAHVYIAWIHPFGDGNGRLARLLELELLFRAGVPDVAAHLLSNHYNKTRDEYYRQLAKTSSVPTGHLIEFIQYALQGFVDGLNEQLELIQGDQLRIHWRNHVYKQFEGQKSATDRRRRDLILELSTKIEQVIPLSQIRRLSPELAEAYANLSERTIQRDLERLQEMDLIVIRKNGVRVKFENLRAFLPDTISNIKQHS